jgi:hypothetical protein
MRSSADCDIHDFALEIEYKLTPNCDLDHNQDPDLDHDLPHAPDRDNDHKHLVRDTLCDTRHDHI